MPNHIHGILIIGDRDVETQFLASSGKSKNPGIQDGIGGQNDKRTYKNTSLHPGIQPTSGSLGSILRGYKIGITKYAKQRNITFKRQSRYHDHIIRDEKLYNNIDYYIHTNPERWKEDRFYK